MNTGDSSHPAPDLVNEDLLPTTAAQRTWDWKAIAALWVGMVVCVPAYMLAAGLVSEGMSWREAVFTIFLANLIVLAPMLLVGHAGAKHGIPFPVLLRASFGTQGAKLPALLRGLVACGWFGIQTWVGGAAIYTIVNVLSGNGIVGERLPVLAQPGFHRRRVMGRRFRWPGAARASPRARSAPRRASPPRP